MDHDIAVTPPSAAQVMAQAPDFATGAPPTGAEANLQLARRGLGVAAFLRSGLVSPTARQGGLALIDQAMVSGVRFCTTVLVGRIAGAEDLGLYSLGFSLVILIGCVQESLITTPYVVYGNRLHGIARAEYAGSILVHAVTLALISIVGLAAGGLVLATGIGPAGLAPVLGMLTIAIPGILLCEFARRFSFAHLRIAKALATDLAIVLLQIGGLSWLVWRGSLSAVSAYGAAALACAASGSVWFYVSWNSFTPQLGQILPCLRRHWSFARWTFAAQAAYALSNQLLYWFLAGLCSREATGNFAACMSVVLLSNPVVLGINNMLMPKTALAFARGGRAGVRRAVGLGALVLGTMTGVICLLIAQFGDMVVDALYANERTGSQPALVLLGLTSVAWALGVVCDDGLMAIERTDFCFKASLLSLLASTVTALLLVPWLGVTGAAWGMLAGNSVGAATRCVAFLLATADRPPQGGPA